MAKVYFYKDSSGQTKASKNPVTSTGKSLTNKTSSVSSNSSKVSNVVSSKVESPKPVQAESTASQLKKQGLVGNVITSASGQKFYTSVSGQRFTTPEAAAQASLKIKAPGAFNPNLKSYGTTQAQQIREAYSGLSYNEAVEQKKYDDMVLGTALKQQRDVEAYNKLQSVQSKLQADKYSGVSGAVNISNAIAAFAKGIATPEQKSIARQAQAQGLTQAPAPVRPEVTWQIPAREAGVALSKGDVIGGLSKLSYSGLTLVKETGDYVSKRGEIIKDYSGFKPANILQGGGLNTRTDVTLGGIGARGESLVRLGVYVSGSAVSGLGSIPSIIGGVGRETPSILTAGAMMVPGVATSFVKNPLGYTMEIGGKAVGVGAGILWAMGTSFVEDPFGFGGQYAGASIGFGLTSKAANPFLLVGSNIKNVALSKFTGLEQSFVKNVVPQIKYKSGQFIQFVDDIHVNPVAGDIKLKKLLGQGNLTQTRTFPEFPSIKNLKTGENVLAIQSPLGARWGLPVRGQTYSQPFKDIYLSARQFGAENFQKTLQKYQNVKLSLLPKSQKTYLFLGQSDIKVQSFANLKKLGYSKKEIAELVRLSSSPTQGGKYNLAIENLIRKSTERQTALQSQGFLSSGQKVAGSNIKLIGDLPKARFYDVVDLPFGLSKIKPLQKAYEITGLGRRWKVADVFKVDVARPRGRPPILQEIGQRQRPTAIVQQGDKFLLVQERTGQFGLLGGARDPLFDPKYYAKSQVKQRGGRWVLEDSIKAIQREAKEEIGFSLSGFKKAGVGSIKSKPYFANEGFLQQDVFNVFVAKGRKDLFSGVAKGFKTGEIKSVQYFTKEQILSMSSKKFTSGTKEIFNRYFGIKPKTIMKTKELFSESSLKSASSFSKKTTPKIVNNKMIEKSFEFRDYSPEGQQMIRNLFEKYNQNISNFNKINKKAGLNNLIRPELTFDDFLKEMYSKPVEVKLSARELAQTTKISDRAVKSYIENYAPIKYYSVAEEGSKIASGLIGVVKGNDYNLELPKKPDYSFTNYYYKKPLTTKSFNYYVPDYSKKQTSYVYPLNNDYNYVPRGSSSTYYPQNYTSPSYYVPPYTPTDYTPNPPEYTPPKYPNYTPPKYIPPYYPPKSPEIKIPPYNPPFNPPKQKRYDFEDNLLKSRRKKYSSKGFSKLYTPSNIENVLLPTKVDWLKAIGVTKTKQPKIETFKSLTLGYSGLKKSAKIIGVRF